MKDLQSGKGDPRLQGRKTVQNIILAVNGGRYCKARSQEDWVAGGMCCMVRRWRMGL